MKLKLPLKFLIIFACTRTLDVAGKSTLTDSHVAADEIISEEVARDVRMTDTRQDKAEQGITIESTGIFLYYKMNDKSLKNFKGNKSGNEYIINLIDSPGHVDEIGGKSQACFNCQ